MREIDGMMIKIFQVRSGQITVVQACEELGISRQTYYELEEKALKAMHRSLIPGEPGRPRKVVDQEKEQLKAQVKDLQKQIIFKEQSLKIQEILNGDIPSQLSKRSTDKVIRQKKRK